MNKLPPENPGKDHNTPSDYERTTADSGTESAKRFLDKFRRNKTKVVQQELRDIAEQRQLDEAMNGLLDKAEPIQLDGARPSLEQFLKKIQAKSDSEDAWLRAAQYGSPEGAALLAHSRKLTEPSLAFQLYVIALQLISREVG